MAAALAAALLAIVLVGERFPGVPGVVRQVFSALSAVAALIAVTVAFDGEIAGPVLLAMAVVVAVAGRRDDVARWVAVGFAIVGAGVHLELFATSRSCSSRPKSTAASGISTLISSILLAACGGGDRLVVDAGRQVDDSAVRVLWSAPAAVIVYAVTRSPSPPAC